MQESKKESREKCCKSKESKKQTVLPRWELNKWRVKMKKHKILLILVVAAIAVALVPLTVSAASPKLNLTKVTLPKNSPNGNGHMYLWVKEGQMVDFK